MKTFNIFFALILSLGVFSACSDRTERAVEREEDVRAIEGRDLRGEELEDANLEGRDPMAEEAPLNQEADDTFNAEDLREEEIRREGEIND
jgi:hypothetical protein